MLLLSILVCTLGACTSQKTISVFEANQIKRTTGETERNHDYIKKLSKECEDNSTKTSVLVQQMKKINEDAKKK